MVVISCWRRERQEVANQQKPNPPADRLMMSAHRRQPRPLWLSAELSRNTDPPFTASLDMSTMSQHVHISVQQLPEQHSDW